MESAVRLAALVIFLFASTLSCVLASSATTNEAAPIEKKAAWEWSDNDRLAARFDNEKIKERFAAAKADIENQPFPEVVTMLNEATTPMNIVSGRTHPELFLLHELLDLLPLACEAGEETEQYRESYADEIHAAGLPPTFWDDFYALGREYFEDEARLTAYLRSTPENERPAVVKANLDALQANTCAHRAKAIRAARLEFGVSFDRFLYTVFAPSQQHVGDNMTAKTLRWIAGGCQ